MQGYLFQLIEKALKMIRLSYTDDDECKRFQSIWQKKHNPARSKLEQLHDTVCNQYKFYINRFQDLRSKAKSNFSAEDTNYLNNCYNNSTIALDRLKAKLRKSQLVHLQRLCPFCQIIPDTATFDHFVPRDHSPEYSVLGKNLVPCCSTCNSKKGTYWKEDGQISMIHFYNDDPNKVRYLNAEVNYINSFPHLNFKLNLNQLPDLTLRFKIEKHYKRLDLIKRFNLNSSQIISEIQIDYDAYREEQRENDDILSFMNKKAIGYFKKYGLNYHVAITYETLAADPYFYDFLVNS